MPGALHGTLLVILGAALLLALANFVFLGRVVLGRRHDDRDVSNVVERFDAEAAERLLLALCVGGPRVTGSSQAAAAVVTLGRELQSIAALASASGATLEVEDVESGEGSFETDFLEGFTDVYQNITSVVARLSWPTSRREAVLLSSHFDSFPGSPGASDDVTQLAAAAGVLRALAEGPPLPVSVLAFFSGAEESNWVAAHAFATTHRWAADYVAVINLEAIGAAGEHIAFQVGPDATWLLAALGRDSGEHSRASASTSVTRPPADTPPAGASATQPWLASSGLNHGGRPAWPGLLWAPSHVPRSSVIAHDIFQIPGFPAGSDFKTLLMHAPRANPCRQHISGGGGGGAEQGSTGSGASGGGPSAPSLSAGLALGVTGIDLATLSWGYAYHTPLDQPSITGGTSQLRRLGGSLLAKVENIAGGLHLALSSLEEEAAARGTGGRAGAHAWPEETPGAAPGCVEGHDGSCCSASDQQPSGARPHVGTGVGGASTGSGSGGATHRAPHQNHQAHDRSPGAVFFDLFGRVWVVYSAAAATRLHVAAIGVGLLAAAVIAAPLRAYAVELAALFAGLLCAAAAGCLVASLHPMGSFGRPALTMALYSAAALAGSTVTRLHLTSPVSGASSGCVDGASSGGVDGALSGAAAPPGSPSKGGKRQAGKPDTAATGAARLGAPGPRGRPGAGALGAGSAACRRAAMASLAPWFAAMIPLGGLGLGSAYLPALFMGCNGAALLLATALCRAGCPALAGVAQTVGALLPALHGLELCSWLLQVLLPISGRMGAVLPSDIVVGVAVGVCSLLPTATLAAPLSAQPAVASAAARWLSVLAGLALCLTLATQPFTAETPKRLVVQHVVRQVDGAPLDSGLWVSAFDPAGLRELRASAAASAAVPAIAHRTARSCDLDPPPAAEPAATGTLLLEPTPRPTGCYLSFPFFFPLGGLLGAPDGVLSVYATSVGGRPVDPPPIPAQLRVRVEVVAAAPGARGLGPHSLRLRLTGPSHMGVAVPEARLSAWSFGTTSRPRPPQARRSPFAPDERVAFAFLTCGSAAASAAPTGGTADAEGATPAPCVWDLVLEVRGSDPLPLAVYGHYVQLTRSEPLEALSAALEPRLRGDWHWFSSMIERTTLQMPQEAGSAATAAEEYNSTAA